MANISRQHVSDNQEKLEKLFEYVLILNYYMYKRRVSVQQLQKVVYRQRRTKKDSKNDWSHYLYLLSVVLVVLGAVFGNILSKSHLLDGLVENTLGVRCVLPNNYFVWEATRPVTDCRICDNMTDVLILHNATREDFASLAYTSKPVVVKQAAAHWPAVKEFDFMFFKRLFEDIEGSYESIEEDCQLLTFKTEFLGLRDVFNMSEKRINGYPGSKPWYVGWSVCQAEMVRRMREHYPRPHFLPEDAEHSHLDYVFMGYQQGAVMHLDYISRLMWQAQLIGRKTWQLVPPPECDHVCSPMSVTVEQGDIILLDTRQWYHDTYVEPGLFSLTVSSEYG